MIRVGLVGEDPNDTSSIAALLTQRYYSKFQFFSLAKRIRGSQLDTEKFIRQVKIDFIDYKCELIICIRDLDSYASDTSRIQKQLNWFKRIDELTNNNGIILLNIWELEALICADIEAFNKIYGTKLSSKSNPSSIKEPKEELKRKTKNCQKQFHESHCPQIFKQLRIDTVIKNCSEFKEFIENLDKKLVA